MMRSSLIAIMLALAKSQQVCKLDYYVDYKDPECKYEHPQTTKEVQDQITKRVNQLIDENAKCAVWDPTMPVDVRAQFTCLDSETVKVEVFNRENEDPDCKYPYPSYSDNPSYIAKNGDCVRSTGVGYTKFYISSTSPTGEFQKTDNSWEIYDVNKEVSKNAGNETEEAKKDREPGANQCMLADFKIYMDKDCKQENTAMTDGQKAFFLYLGNTEIQSEDCIYSNKKTMKGVMARSYCLDDKTVTINSYNGINEDPLCLRPYPENGNNYTSLTTTTGQCTWMGNGMYAVFDIQKYDGRQWNYDDVKQWDMMPGPDDHMNGMNGTMEGWNSQKFNMAGDNYNVNVEVHMSEEGGQKIVTETKFDDYFMYSIDKMGPMGEDGYGSPPCGPGAKENMCQKQVYSQNTCCTHVQMKDHSNNMQHSFYRCMNQKVVDAAFSVEIDGMMMSMQCTGDSMGSAGMYFSSGAAILASIMALISMSAF